MSDDRLKQVPANDIGHLVPDGHWNIDVTLRTHRLISPREKPEDVRDVVRVMPVAARWSAFTDDELSRLRHDLEDMDDNWRGRTPDLLAEIKAEINRREDEA